MMTRPWKTLLVSVALFQLALTIAFWRMVDYLQWLHFADSVVEYEGFMDTTPGQTTGTFLGITAVVLIIINLALLSRKPSEVSESGSGDK